MMSKRGISPIIATVLLLGFTVALATTVFLWMKGQTETLSESTVEYAEGELQCQNVRINVQDESGVGTKCKKLNIQNVGYLDINSVAVREFCTDGSANSSLIKIDLKPKVIKGGVEVSGYEKLLGESEAFCSGGINSCVDCKKVEVTPIIEVLNRKVGCKDKMIVTEC